MDPLWLSFAFAFGFLSRLVGLPPLVGYLVAGFILHSAGVQGGDFISGAADLGILLLLFSIGLKLKLRGLLRPEVWAGATIHMALTVLVFSAGIYGATLVGINSLGVLDLPRAALIGFALSFSSTVFAVKTLEQRGEMAALHGRVAIGILIMQDLIAVVFLTLSKGTPPSPWAIVLIILLVALRPLFMWLLNRVGHGELLVLFGLLLPLGVGVVGFELVGIKADLGALVAGILVAAHPKASELADDIFRLKDLLLVGFFLSIGLSGEPNLSSLGIAVVLALIVPFKVALYFILLTRFKLRARTSLLTSLSLANYSEFGLIVGTVGLTAGWIQNDWLIIIAIALSISFIIASAVNAKAHSVSQRLGSLLHRLETSDYHSEDQVIDCGDAEVAIFGMGRVGSGAYDEMKKRFGENIIGVDFNPDTVKANREAGRKVILGDATDPGFWDRVKPGKRIKAVLLAMPQHRANMYALRQVKDRGHVRFIAATARHDDEVAELGRAGATAAFNFYAEAGAGFADHVLDKISVG